MSAENERQHSPAGNGYLPTNPRRKRGETLISKKKGPTHRIGPRVQSFFSRSDDQINPTETLSRPSQLLRRLFWQRLPSFRGPHRFFGGALVCGLSRLG